MRFEEDVLVEHAESAENLMHFGAARELLPSPAARRASSELAVMDFPLTDQKVEISESADQRYVSSSFAEIVDTTALLSVPQARTGL